MNNDWPKQEKRPLNVIMDAWRKGFWISREEEARVKGFGEAVKAIHTAAKRPRKKLATSGSKPHSSKKRGH